eukprot:806563-Pyramimonas_sp.AAC.1
MPTSEELLATNTQKPRQLQAQQGRIKHQLVAAATSQKEPEEKLLANIQQCLDLQVEVDAIKTPAGAAMAAATAEAAAAEESFPELGGRRPGDSG